MNYIGYVLVLLCFLTVIAVISALNQHQWLATLATVTIAVLTTLILIGGMDGMRAHVERVRSNGEGEEFVKGMIERQQYLTPPRIAVGAGVGCLLIIAIVAVRRR